MAHTAREAKRMNERDVRYMGPMRSQVDACDEAKRTDMWSARGKWKKTTRLHRISLKSFLEYRTWITYYKTAHLSYTLWPKYMSIDSSIAHPLHYTALHTTRLRLFFTLILL